MKRLAASLLLALTFASWITAAEAQQDPWDFANIIRSGSQQASDLTFPTAAEAEVSGSPRMAIFKPDGAGPFPAVVIAHTCGGLHPSAGKDADEVMFAAAAAVQRGYVAFVVDVLTQRRLTTVCNTSGNVGNFRALRDLFQAAAHLRRFAFVDKSKVVLAGFSWGAQLSALASSRLMGDVLKVDERFVAAVANYPGCHRVVPPRGNYTYDFIRPDIDRPFLALMGDADTEATPAECVQRLEAAKSAKAPVEWFMFPGATHCWDCKSLDGLTKTIRGQRIVYRYDPAINDDATTRMFAFFDQQLGRKAN